MVCPSPHSPWLCAHCDCVCSSSGPDHLFRQEKEPQRQCAWFMEPGSSVTSDWLQLPHVELSHPNSPAGLSLPASGLTDILLLLGPRGPSPESLCLSLICREIVLLLPRADLIPSTPWRPAWALLPLSSSLYCVVHSHAYLPPNLQADCTW